MSVYTSITFPQLQAFLSDYDLGRLLTFEGIQDGIMNTNYLVLTTQGEFVLTLFETVSVQDVVKISQLLVELGAYHAIYPRPIPDQLSRYVKLLHNKPALICVRIAGKAPIHATLELCKHVGAALAKLHQAGLQTEFNAPSDHTLASLKRIYAKVAKYLAREDRELIIDELGFQEQFEHEALPTGLIHGDLFKDNVLVLEGKITGIIDFYSASQDALLRDVAIAVNDWCYDQGHIQQEKVQAILTGYEQVRPLTMLERQNWSAMLRISALRFWLSRLVHQFHKRPGELTHVRNPDIFRQILLQHRESEYA